MMLPVSSETTAVNWIFSRVERPVFSTVASKRGELVAFVRPVFWTLKETAGRALFTHFSAEASQAKVARVGALSTENGPSKRAMVAFAGTSVEPVMVFRGTEELAE